MIPTLTSRHSLRRRLRPLPSSYSSWPQHSLPNLRCMRAANARKCSFASAASGYLAGYVSVTNSPLASAASVNIAIRFSILLRDARENVWIDPLRPPGALLALREHSGTLRQVSTSVPPRYACTIQPSASLPCRYAPIDEPTALPSSRLAPRFASGDPRRALRPVLNGFSARSGLDSPTRFVVQLPTQREPPTETPLATAEGRAARTRPRRRLPHAERAKRCRLPPAST